MAAALHLIVGVLAISFCAVWLSCASNQPLYVYRAYQDPRTARGPYYLRETLVVAPDYATALDIVARTLTEIHPAWSGPIYISLLGVAEGRREPGLLGGPVWFESSGVAAESPSGASDQVPAAQGGSAKGFLPTPSSSGRSTDRPANSP